MRVHLLIHHPTGVLLLEMTLEPVFIPKPVGKMKGRAKSQTTRGRIIRLPGLATSTAIIKITRLGDENIIPIQPT